MPVEVTLRKFECVHVYYLEQKHHVLKYIQHIQGFERLRASLPLVVLFLLRSPHITITKWHMPFVHQQLVCAMEETFSKKGGKKFANINLVSN